MYNTGTVTTTANSTKLVGTGTKWLNNINRVSAEQAIQIQIGTTVHNNSIQSIQSDTELTLNFPLPTSATGAKYVILTTMVHSGSDAMNKIVSMNVSNVQFSDILTRWMTEQGIITVTLPDQTTQQLRTTKEMDKQLDGKFDKAGGVITRDGESITIRTTKKTQATIGFRGSDNELRGYIGNPNDSDRFAITNQKTSKSLALTESGKLKYDGTDVMLMGDFGFGGFGADRSFTEAEILAFMKDRSTVSQVLRNSNVTTSISYRFSPIIYSKSANTWAAFTADIFGGGVKVSAGDDGQANTYTLWTNKNTTKDSNGNLKAASPIIRVFADHIELNEESEGVELEKLGAGRYKLKGTLGMHSDASWGGIHGGLVVPNGINNLPLVWADFDVLPDGDIVIETRYRKHALHPMLEAQRLMTYPEFLDENNEEREDYDYCDIPNGHWIDVRVNMPSNSIYNQKQAEAERLAKLEAERLAQEEAKRAAEEAERAAEEAERAEQEGQNEA